MNPLLLLGLGAGALALLAFSRNASAAPPLSGGGTRPPVLPPLEGGGQAPTAPPPLAPGVPAGTGSRGRSGFLTPLGGGGRRSATSPRITAEQRAQAQTKSRAQRDAERLARTQAAQAAFIAQRQAETQQAQQAAGGAVAQSVAQAAGGFIPGGGLPGGIPATAVVKVPVLLLGISTTAREGLQAINPAEFGLGAPTSIPGVGSVYLWNAPADKANQAGAANLGSAIAAKWGGTVVSTKDFNAPVVGRGITITVQ